MALEFVHNEQGFRLSWKNRIILQHNAAAPAVFVGTGRNISKSHSGFFRIKEKNRKLEPLASWKVLKQNDGLIRLELDGKLELTSRIDGDHLVLSPKIGNSEAGYNRFKLLLKADPHEKIFGCGEQFGRLNLRGRKVPVWLSESGVGRRFDLLTIGFVLKTKHIPRWYNTYISMPTWVSSGGLYCHCGSMAYTELDFRQAASHGIYCWEIPSEIRIGVESSLPNAVAGLNKMLGRQPPPPQWIYDGLILGVQGGEQVVRNKLGQVKRGGVKVAALWCQDWEGCRETNFGKQLRWAWEYDSQLYPELPRFIGELKKQGIRYLGYNNTFLTPGSKMYDEAVEKGYLIRRDSGDVYTVDVPFDPAGMVDFTNPPAKAWLKDIIRKNMIEIGLSGWMADMGEMVPPRLRCLFRAEGQRIP